MLSSENPLITHSIKHPDNKHIHYPAPYVPHRPVYAGPNWQPGGRDKLRLAKYQKEMGYKAGDFVVRTAATKPYTAAEVIRIAYVEEIIQNMKDEDWSADNKPLCYHLESLSAKRDPNFVWKSSLDWVKPVDHEDLPAAWLAKLAIEKAAADRADNEGYSG